MTEPQSQKRKSEIIERAMRNLARAPAAKKVESSSDHLRKLELLRSEYAAAPTKLSAAALRVCGIEPPDTSGPDFDEMREILR